MQKYFPRDRLSTLESKTLMALMGNSNKPGCGHRRGGGRVQELLNGLALSTARRIRVGLFDDVVVIDVPVVNVSGDEVGVIADLSL